MNKIEIINAGETHKKTNLNRNTATLIFMIFLFLIGEIVGTRLFLNMNEEQINSLASISDSFFSNRINLSFYENMINSFSSGFSLLFVTFLLGFGIIFQPITLLVPFYKGLGIGMVFSEMINCFDTYDAVISLAVILPYSVLSTFVIIIGAREAFNMSCGFFRYIFGKKTGEINVRLYLNKFLILTVLLLIFSVIDSIVIFLGSVLV